MLYSQRIAGMGMVVLLLINVLQMVGNQSLTMLIYITHDWNPEEVYRMGKPPGEYPVT